VFKNSDLLFENNSLHISCNGEFRKNMGRLTIIYTNKTQYTFQNIQIISDELENEIKLNIMPLSESILGPNGRIQQFIE
jgi:hypothetical protein